MSSGRFYPSLAYISAVTQGLQTVVTFTANHDFTEGEIISFRISVPFGMVELNNQQMRVLAKTSNTITVNINSLNFTPFVNAGIYEAFPAIVVPAGSGIVPGERTPAMNLKDAFDDIPPSG